MRFDPILNILDTDRPWPVRQLIALNCIGLAIAVRLGLEATIPGIVPFATLYPAVLIATLLAGAGAGATVVVLGGFASWYLFLPPATGFALVSIADAVSLFLFILTSGLIVYVTARLRRAFLHLQGTLASLAGSEARLRRAYDAAEMGDWEWELDTNRLIASDSFYRLLGRTPATGEVLQNGFYSLIHPADRDRLRQELDAALTGPARIVSEWRALLPDGSERWLMTRGEVIRTQDNRPAKITAVSYDIAPRKAAEETLRVHEERYRRLFTSMSEGFVLAELLENEQGEAVDYRVLDVNPAFTELTSFPMEHAIGHTAREIWTDLAPSWIERFAAVVRDQQPCRFEERSTRTTRWFEIRAFPERERRFGYVFLDITARKSAEEELRATLNQREVLLRELNHRVANNLQMIGSLLQLQANRVIDGESRKQIEKARQRVATLGSLHAQLYQRRNIGTVDFGAYLRHLCEKIADSLLDESDLQLEVEAEACELDIDQAIPLGLVVNELVTNAIKYAYPENTLGIVHIGFHPHNDGYLLSIRDNGVGLPNDIAERPHGLGMMLVQALVRQARGKLDIGQRPGTCFQIWFTAQKPRHIAL